MAHWQPSEKAKIILQKWYPNVSKERLSPFPIFQCFEKLEMGLGTWAWGRGYELHATLKDLRFVVKALKTLSSRWEDIGMTIDVIDLGKIKKEYRGMYKCLIAVINSWLSGNYHMERDGSNAPSWWKIVDIVADDIGGADPNRAKSIAQSWQDLGKDNFSPLALTASNNSLSCERNASQKSIAKLVTALQGAASKWFEIATLLGIPVDKLNSFKEKCEGSTEACLKEVIKEWLTGGYNPEHGYPAPSMRVLVDVVEHQAGGADPSLARQLTQLNISSGGSSGEPCSSQVAPSPPAVAMEQSQRPAQTNGASGWSHRVHGSGSSEEALQLQVSYDRPNTRNLSIIKWRNESGDTKKFRLRSACIHKWKKIGYLVVPRPQLEAWSRQFSDANDCCEAVFSHWLDHPPHDYPVTWEGLYELLDDSELGEVTVELKRAVENAITV